MRGKLAIVLSICMTASTADIFVSTAVSEASGADSAVQMEYLDRGTVAVMTDEGVFLSWRLLGTENYDTTFDIYRDGIYIATVSDKTNFIDSTAGEKYIVVPSGEPQSSGKTVRVNSKQYISILLDRPDGGTSLDGEVYTYSPNDVTPADVDGDGEYELILKWEPSNSFDSGKNAKYNGNVYIDCYKLSGEKLWRIDMGININAGAHFTQMAAYDFDLDGKAELAIKTAPGTIDGTGKYVSEASLFEEIKETDNTVDYRHSEYGINDTGGRVMSGPEFYTVFQGDTGAALDTVYYPHPRSEGYWGDNWGNRSERYLTGAAYLDGQTPSIIAWRGYYEKTTVTAYNLVDKRLVKIADFNTDNGNNYLYAGNGNHNLTVGDVDGDGRDEILCGSLALDDDLSVLWCSGRGHGDALHLADYDPTHNGMEYFSVHEDYSGNEITGSTTGHNGEQHLGGMTLYKAESGEELFHVDTGGDTGRGMMANVGYSDGYFDFWGAGNYTSYGGDNISRGNYSSSSTNQRIFWNGDTYDELLDGTGSSNYGRSIAINGKNGRIATFDNVLTNNGTKNNPCLIADLFGDWREEFVARSSDNTALIIYTTTIPTNNKLYTLMHDRTYRMQVACQNAGYNQPPHIGYYINNENGETDNRKYAAYIKTVYNDETSVRTENLPENEPIIITTPIPSSEPTSMPEQTIDPSIEFVVEDGVLIKYKGEGGDVTVPDIYGGQKITSIGRGAFSGNEDVTSVVIENGISEIRSGAFENCTLLSEVTLSENVDIVYALSFAGCKNLANLIVKGKNTELNDLFGSIEQNKKLTIYGLSDSGAETYAMAYNADFIATDIIPTLSPSPEPTPTQSLIPTCEPEPIPTTVPDFEVNEYGELEAYNGVYTNIVIPETVNGITVTSISAGVFEEKTEIKSIALPDSIISIGRGTFSGCAMLEEVNTQKIESVGDYAFYNCSILKELTFEKDVRFGRNILDGCTSLNKLTILGMNTYMENFNEGVSIYGYKGSAIEYSALMEDIPFYDIKTGELVKKDFIVNPNEGSLDEYKGNESAITIPTEVDGVEINIIGNAFAESDIVSVIIPESVSVISYDAFEGCNFLKNITLSSSITHLLDSFSGCESLEYIRIPNSVTYIEDGIFNTCPNVVIHCGENSAAHIYAVKNGIPFVIDIYEDDPTPKPEHTTEPVQTEKPTEQPSYTPYEILSTTTGGNVRPGNIVIILKCNIIRENATLVLAEYEENGKLKGIQLEPIKMSIESTKMTTMKYSGAKAKVFVWDIDSMQSYAETYKVGL